MVLSTVSNGESQNSQMMGGGGAGGGGGTSNGSNFNGNLIHEFEELMKIYKPLECVCCDKVVGYTERKTGRVLCRPSCDHTRNHQHISTIQTLNVRTTNTLSGNALAGDMTLSACVDSKARASPNKELDDDSKGDQLITPYPVISRQSDKDNSGVLLPLKSSEFRWTCMKYSPNLIPGATVRVTHAWAVNKYHVVADVDAKAIDEMNLRVANYVADNPDKTLKRRPQVDDIVLALYGGTKGEFYRAKVLECTDEGSDVEFIDYGDTESISFQNMYEVNKELMYPVYGLRLNLLGVPDGDYTGAPAPKKLQNIEDKEFILDLVDDMQPGKNVETEGKLWLGKETVNDIILSHLIEAGKISGNN